MRTITDDVSEECPGCEDYGCQDCCPHDEKDHDQCVDCGKEFDPGLAIDRAMDSLDYER